MRRPSFDDVVVVQHEDHLGWGRGQSIEQRGEDRLDGRRLERAQQRQCAITDDRLRGV
jgi:hypothetical protein